MDYIMCSVVWKASEEAPGYTAQCIAAARSDGGRGAADSFTFNAGDHKGCGEMLAAFNEWCGSEYMLCLWDGCSAGRMKKLLAYYGMRHPYVHLYHLVKVFELTESKCRDASKKMYMRSCLEHKPFYCSKRAAAEKEVRWMCSIFRLLDFSLMNKKPAVDFIRQPSNKYFVLKKGKCFHTADCRLVKDAAVSSLRAFTYYSSAVDAGFTPCQRCKPADNDTATAAEMQEMNRVKRCEAMSDKSSSQKKSKKSRPLNVYRSLSHMCGIYGLACRKSSGVFYIETDNAAWCFQPEAQEIELMKRSGEEYVSSGLRFADPYQAVRYIVKSGKDTQKK